MLALCFSPAAFRLVSVGSNAPEFRRFDQSSGI
jgi:hypothetical protein